MYDVCIIIVCSVFVNIHVFVYYANLGWIENDSRCWENASKTWEETEMATQLRDCRGQ